MAEDKNLSSETEVAADTAVAEQPKKAAKPKKAKRNVPIGQVHILATFNNTLITVTDPKGDTLSSASAGRLGFKGSKKGTAYAAQLASERALTNAKQSYGLSKVDVFVGGIGLGRDAAIRAIANTDILVESIQEETTVPHGGVRPKKPRRG